MWLAHTEIDMTSRHLINHTKFMKHIPLSRGGDEPSVKEQEKTLNTAHAPYLVKESKSSSNAIRLWQPSFGFWTPVSDF